MTTAPIEPFGIRSRIPLSHVEEWVAVPVSPDDYEAPIANSAVHWSRIERQAAEDASQRPGATRTALVEVIKALRDPQYEFRTAAAIERQTGLSRAQVQVAIDLLGTAIRRPVGAKGEECDYLRLVERGLTRGERLRHLKYMVTRG